jgi:hypothetical protein
MPLDVALLEPLRFWTSLDGINGRPINLPVLHGLGFETPPDMFMLLEAPVIRRLTTPFLVSFLNLLEPAVKMLERPVGIPNMLKAAVCSVP